MRAYERLLNYVNIDTTADENNPNCPSSGNQWILAKQLVEELKSLGIDNAHVDENCYVYAKIPAKGNSCPHKIGFISHMDTSPACAGGPVKTSIIHSYDGGDITLKNGLVIEATEYDFLQRLIGDDLIVTDGETLLGADNKAGVSIIMTLAEELMKNDAPDHCEVLIGFTPDEEIGRGADLFRIDHFGADFAYTVDGGELGEIEYENFNAASANVKIKGLSIHPGSAKLKMKNAIRISAKFDALLPEFERPEYTEGYEGFFHLMEIKGTEEVCSLSYIIRDHSKKKYQQKIEKMHSVCSFINTMYGEGTAAVEIKETYLNMKEIVLQRPEVTALAKTAFEEEGITPLSIPIRGGTDGARLSYMGLVCPNLSTGGYNFHSRKELVSIQSMDKMVRVLKRIVCK